MDQQGQHKRWTPSQLHNNCYFAAGYVLTVEWLSQSYFGPRLSM